MRLDPAEALAPPDRVRAVIVITLRNGVDHVALLPKRYPDVVSGVIRVELERVSPALIRQSPPSFAWSSGAYNRPLPNCGRQGIDWSTRDDELSLLWRHSPSSYPSL